MTSARKSVERFNETVFIKCFTEHLLGTLYSNHHCG